MQILLIIGIFFLLLISYILYKIILNPYLQLKKVKSKYGDEVQTCFYPFIGHYYKMMDPSNKHQIPSMLALKNQNPEKPLKFLATNYNDKVCYYVTDQNMVKEFLNSKVSLYQKVQGMALQDLTVYKGLLFQEGAVHKNQRKMMGQFFHFEAMQDRIQPISKFATELIDTIKSHNAKKDGSKLAISNPMRKVTGGVVSAVFFGEDFVNKTIDDQPITVAIYEAITFSFKLGAEDPLVLARGMLLGHQDTHKTPNFLRPKEEIRLLEKIKKIRQLIQTEIEKRMETYEDDKKQGKKQDFLSLHLDQYYNQDKDKDSFILTIDHIIQQYLTFFFAGMDTTATYLTVSMYYIAKYPDVQEKIRQEFLEHIPDINNITLDQTKGLKIFEAFAQEVLRIISVAPELFHREALKDHQLGDLQIKKGDIVNLNLYGNSNNPQQVENPEQFNINRWLDEKFLKNLQPFTNLPFSSGPRNCIGQHLAKIEFKLTMAFLLRNFKIVPEEDHQPDTVYLFLNTFKDDQIAKFIPL